MQKNAQKRALLEPRKRDTARVVMCKAKAQGTEIIERKLGIKIEGLLNRTEE